MEIRPRTFGGCCIFLLMAVGGFGANRGDLRLVQAVKSKDQAAVRTLLKDGVDVNVPQTDGATAVQWAAHWDDLETAELLIRAGANVNAANNYGVTALWLACTNRSAAMVQKLLQAGATPNPALASGETALMECARTGAVDAVKLLLAHGANPNAKESRRGQTALMWAVWQKHPEVVRALVEHGADVHARSNGMAKDECFLTNTRDPDFPEANYQANDVPTACAKYIEGGFTPLLFAARQGDLDSARILLAAGADVNDRTPGGMSALLMASASGHEGFSVFLVEKGADPNAADGNGLTALHYSLVKGMTYLRGSIFEPEFAYLYVPDMPELVKALLAHGGNPNVRIVKEPPRVDVLLKAKMGLVGATPFLLAAAAAEVGIMRDLWHAGADPLLTTKDRTTPLMVAAGLGRAEDRPEEEHGKALEAVKLALELGADPNAANMHGQTALHGAAFMGENEIIRFLAARGTKLDVKDTYGQTPLDMAEGIIPKALVLIYPSKIPTVRKDAVKLLRNLGASSGDRPTTSGPPEASSAPAEATH